MKTLETILREVEIDFPGDLDVKSFITEAYEAGREDVRAKALREIQKFEGETVDIMDQALTTTEYQAIAQRDKEILEFIERVTNKFETRIDELITDEQNYKLGQEIASKIILNEIKNFIKG